MSGNDEDARNAREPNGHDISKNMDDHERTGISRSAPEAPIEEQRREAELWREFVEHWAKRPME